MEKHQIYWWNLENLFDVEDSPTRPEWLQTTLKNELKGWTQAVLDKKIANLSNIISKFNDSKGPDLMGVCEIENKDVIEKLVAVVSQKTDRAYKVVHHESKDKRGIDIAFIYDPDKYETVGELYSLEIMKRSATRDVIQMTFKTKKGNELTILGNHFPSRSGGQYETEPYRIMAAETVAYWIDRIHEIKGEDHPVVLMGDFNDEPFSRSLTDYLLSTGIKQKVSSAKNHYLYNLMYIFLGDQKGTHVFGNSISILDQFMVSKSISSGSSQNKFKVASVDIVSYPEMIKGKYNTPIRFSRPSAGDYNPEGFSDHLPIELILTEK